MLALASTLVLAASPALAVDGCPCCCASRRRAGGRSRSAFPRSNRSCATWRAGDLPVVRHVWCRQQRHASMGRRAGVLPAAVHARGRGRTRPHLLVRLQRRGVGHDRRRAVGPHLVEPGRRERSPEYSATAKSSLGTWDTQFDDDYAAWLASLPLRHRLASPAEPERWTARPCRTRAYVRPARRSVDDPRPGRRRERFQPACDRRGRRRPRMRQPAIGPRHWPPRGHWRPTTGTSASAWPRSICTTCSVSACRWRRPSTLPEPGGHAGRPHRVFGANRPAPDRPPALAAPGPVLLLQRRLCHRIQARLCAPHRRCNTVARQPCLASPPPCPRSCHESSPRSPPPRSAPCPARFAPPHFCAGVRAAGFDKIEDTVTNINDILVTISVAVVTISIIWAGFKMIFQGARLADVANVLIGGTLVGGAAFAATSSAEGLRR